jgi:transcriptional antiterminator
MSVYKFAEVLKYIDSLVKRKATGTPKELANRLNVSESTVYNHINLMKSLDAPIRYCNNRRSYVYDLEGTFNFGFVPLSTQEEKSLLGGYSSDDVKLYLFKAA